MVLVSWDVSFKKLDYVYIYLKWTSKGSLAFHALTPAHDAVHLSSLGKSPVSLYWSLRGALKIVDFCCLVNLVK